MSEKITWEVCPGCGRTAAAGWLDGHVVEVDCVSGCCLSDVQRSAIERLRDPHVTSRRLVFVRRG
jgi:hypothetical protein